MKVRSIQIHFDEDASVDAHLTVHGVPVNTRLSAEEQAGLQGKIDAVKEAIVKAITARD